jgi:carbamoyltransferase
MNRPMIVLGLKCFSHDTGAAIVGETNGRLAVHAISEARLNRRKHSFAYPLMSIAYCLEAFGLKSLDEVDLVCIDRHMELWPEPRSQYGYAAARARRHPRYDDNHRWNYLIEQTLQLDRAKVRLVNHVDAHAASAYFASPFDTAAVLIAEGGTGIYRGEGTSLHVIDRMGYLGDTWRDGRVVSPRKDHFVNPSFLYDAISALLGYDVFGAGQTMALAGFADRFAKRDYFTADPDRFDGFIINHDKTVHGMHALAKYVGNDKDIVAEPWVNLARQAQDILRTDLLHLARLARAKVGMPSLAYAGGAALNCLINAEILHTGTFDELFVQPAASDEGIPLGCALHGYHALGGKQRFVMENAYLGRTVAPAPLSELARAHGLAVGTADTDAIAALLANGAIIGRCVGPSEYGPRALGNRSILADPRAPGMKDRLNAEIKHREGFRPFAPSCLADAPPDWLKAPGTSPFMLLAGQATELGQKSAPAVIHADGSSRVQAVTRAANPSYYDLIKAFGARTGCAVLLNTSFNDKDEPIVETEEDAINCMLRTGLDAVVLGDRLVSRTALTRPADPEVMRRATEERVNFAYRDLIERFCDMEAYVALATKLNDDAIQTVP